MALLAIWECPSPLTSHANAQSPTYAIAIHGGAGVEPAKLTPQQRKDHEDALRRAITHGRDLLAQGQPALAVVESTIRLLEEEPLFNAGRGAVFNNVGKHELDAAIMDGLSGKGGAVAGVTTIKNPISLARLVMSKTNHVLLIGDGAEKFADEMAGEPMIERVPNNYFSTEMRRREWEEAVQAAKSSADANRSNALPDPAGKGKSTVGCVALDREGNLAAGTSTGGLTNKKWGRVGSVPILGAGTFASNETLAVSGTGIGEHFIRQSVGFHLHSLMKYKSLSLKQSVEEMIDTILENDTGGVITVNRKGEIEMRCNTPGMSRAAADSNGRFEIRLER